MNATDANRADTAPYTAIDDLVFESMGIGAQVASSLRCNQSIVPPLFTPRTDDLLSFALGCCFGRWTLSPLVVEPYRLLDPICDVPPAVRDAGEDAATADGILADDSEANYDIVATVCSAIERLSSPQNVEAVEHAVCQNAGAANLREYFRSSNKGGFWQSHLDRYDKSRRKAPIYWLLQSSKKNYAIWLYYHRLDKDLLFKTLVNYVEPKIRLETSRLESLRSQKAAAGESGKEAKRLAKDVERQEDFLSELRDFEDKLRRAANLHLEPDLNDGVVLNIAPLHELVPWKEAKKYWNELMEGKYEWSSIGKQLREKGLVQ